MEPNPLAGTVTMLFTDIEGSTALVQRLGDSYGDLLHAHHDLLRAVIAGYGGRVVDMQGDAFFFAFPTARGALLAGVEAQRQLADHAWPGGVTLHVRMGMHTGEPAIGSEGYLGIDVIKAARICSAAHGGQLIISESTHALVASDPPGGIRFQDLGEHGLKGIDRPQRLYQVEAPELLERFPAPRTGVSDPASIAGMEDRAYALSERLGTAVMSHVETAMQHALEREPDEDRSLPAGEVMKRAAVGLSTLLLLVVVIAASIWLVKAVV